MRIHEQTKEVLTMRFPIKALALLLTMALCLSLLPASVLAASTVIDSGTCGENLTWKLTDTGVLTISGTGEMDDYEYYKNPAAYPVGETKHPVPWASHYVLMQYGESYPGQYNFPDYYCTEIKKVVVKEGVTRIGNHAFCNMINLKNVSLPKSLTAIGERAFSDNAFTGISLPEGLREIGKKGFFSCKNLKQIEIPGSVTKIDERTFYMCTALEHAVLNPGVKTIGDYGFIDCRALETVSIPATVTSIGAGAFWYCSSLNGVTLPAGLKSLGRCAFQWCYSLERLEIPTGVTAIKTNCFRGCKSLKQVVLPAGVKKIGSSAFLSCTSLEEIKIPAGVTEISYQTFYNCSSLKRLVLPATINKIDARNSYNCKKLAKVDYRGTPEQWNAIDLNTKQNYYLLRAVSYNLPLCKISTKYANYSYTGKAVKPGVTVMTWNDVKLQKDRDYTVSYKNNKNYGTATVTVTGIGKYSGSATRTFRIAPAKVQNLKIDRHETYAKLSWTANPEATSYRVYKSGVLQGKTAKCSFRLEGLTAKTKCTVTVKAVVERANPKTGEAETLLGVGASVKINAIS